MIIAIAGNRKEAGKSTVAKIIQWITQFQLNEYPQELFLSELANNKFDGDVYSEFTVRKFADTLKDFVCTLIDKDRQWLEENKNTELGERWIYWKKDITGHGVIETQHTPRTLMIQIANNLRETVHPDIWITPLLDKYKPIINNGLGKLDEYQDDEEERIDYPKWIIDDLRYPNEFERLKELGAITIYVERGENKHTKSEGLLDKNDFDYVIDNNGSLSDLINEVKRVYGKI